MLGRSLLALRRRQQIRSLTPCGRSSYSLAVPTLSYGRRVWGGAWQQHRHLSPVRVCQNVVSLERLILVACHTGRIHARSIRHEESLRMITRTECRCASSVWRALKCDSCWGSRVFPHSSIAKDWVCVDQSPHAGKCLLTNSCTCLPESRANTFADWPCRNVPSPSALLPCAQECRYPGLLATPVVGWRP